jgi:Family of unknown function (DUF6680)
MTTEAYALLIAIFSAIATACAAIATWRAPQAAAKLAESLRRDAQRHEELLRRKQYILATLMQERAQIYSENAVRALNSIDVVFNESREVREAWSELLSAFGISPLPQPLVDERIRKLLSAIAKDIGLTDTLRNDDLGRVYFPTALAQDQFIRQMQRQQMLAALQRENMAPASTTSSQTTLWPPKPD